MKYKYSRKIIALSFAENRFNKLSDMLLAKPPIKEKKAKKCNGYCFYSYDMNCPLHGLSESTPTQSFDKPKELSNCCGADLTIYSGEEGTNFHICSKCLQACDVKTQTKSREM
jgi:hypothetical protein